MTLLKEHLGPKEQQLLKSCDKRGLGLLQRNQCDFPGGSNGKESACNAGDHSRIPGSERSPGKEPNVPCKLKKTISSEKTLKNKAVLCYYVTEWAVWPHQAFNLCPKNIFLLLCSFERGLKQPPCHP